MLEKQYRLTRTKDFECVFQNGERSGNRQFLIHHMQNKYSHPRIAFVVSKKISKKAVERNTIKRRMREVIRLNLSKIDQPLDLIIMAKLPVKAMDFQEMRSSLLHALNTIKITKRSHSSMDRTFPS